jgi:PadR family transcriptional regulator PadR
MGTQKPRLTTQTLKVLGVFMSRPSVEFSGAEIARITGLASGTLYPILLRLENAKWVESVWESGDPRELGRPRRRLYGMTAVGKKYARSAIREFAAAIGIGRPAWVFS